MGDDLVDQANADAEADLHIRPHQSDAHLLRAVEDALVRITQDRFGMCEMCSSPISKDAAGSRAMDAPVPRLQGTRTVSRLRIMLRLQIHAAKQVGEARVGAHRLGAWTIRISKGL